MRRENRLRGKGEFQRIFDTGETTLHRYVVVHRVMTGDGRPARVGIAVGRKLGGAVVRNRLRRRLRAVLDSLVGELRPGVKMVIVARAAARDASPQELQTGLAQALEEAGVLKGQRE